MCRLPIDDAKIRRTLYGKYMMVEYMLGTGYSILNRWGRYAFGLSNDSNP